MGGVEVYVATETFCKSAFHHGTTDICCCVSFVSHKKYPLVIQSKKGRIHDNGLLMLDEAWYGRNAYLAH